ncbi:MAG: peptidylprolyl isomerase [Dehalococcoidia bacterium]|nr:peptidylprolyl isomerase [Dehalococcoidia bacterium]
MPQYSAPPSMSINPDSEISAIINTSSGQIKINFFPSDAPITVNNFVFLAKEGYYDDVIFHRVVEGFMIQGGDPTGTGMGGPGYTFPDEPVSRDYLRGTMAMANAGPNTNGSQFFIMHKNGGLPKNYTIFGEVVEGIDVVDTIANLEVSMSGSGEMSKPVNPTKILDIAIEEI